METTLPIVLIVASIACFVIARLLEDYVGWMRCPWCGVYWHTDYPVPPTYAHPNTGKRIRYALCQECAKKRDEEELEALRKP